MADRDMSYELDGVFASRNAGELVSVHQTRTKVVRASGLQRLGSPLGTPKTTRLAAKPYTNLDRGMGTPMRGSANRNLNPPMSRPATGLSDGYLPMGGLGLDLPLIGTVSWPQLGIGLAIGMGLMALLRKR